MNKYKAGDVVIIKSWDQMVEEFGTRGSYIQTDPPFGPNMRYLCDEAVVLQGSRAPTIYAVLKRDRSAFDDEFAVWYLSDDMILCRADELDNDNTESEVFGYEI